MPTQLRIVPFLLLIALFTILSSCQAGPSDTQNLIYGLTLSPSGIDPHINASAELGIPLSSIYDTLIFQDPDTGAFVPGLAERWSIAEDGLVYTFELRQDVFFHDGTPFDAKAVKANIDYVIHPDHLSQKASLMLGPLDRVEVLDEYRVRFYLREPYAPLLDSLAQVYLGMASPRALTEWGPGEYQFHQVGTGPYRFVEYIPNDHITLEKNQDYTWGPSIYEQKQAQIQRITFQFYEDPATRSLALESGDVDVIGEVPPRDASRLDQDPSFRLHPIPIPGQPLQYFFNTQRPPTDDLQVRLALIHAVDRERIVEIIFGTYSPVANGPLSAPTMGAFADHPSPSYDPTRAILLLEAAGWTRDKGQDVWVKDGSPLSLHIVAPPWGSNPAVAQLLKAAWEEIGTEVTIEIAPGFGPLKQIRDSGQYDLIGLNFFGTDPDLLRPFYQSDGIYNWSGITDHELDQWLELGSQVTLDQSERLAYYRLTWDRIIDAAVLLPVRDYVNLVVARSDIEGLRFSSQGWFPFLIDLRIQPSEQ